MEVTTWNQVMLQLVSHLAEHPELVLVALTELLRHAARFRAKEDRGWSLEKIKTLKHSGAGVFSIVIVKLIIGGGFPFIGMLTYLIRVL